LCLNSAGFLGLLFACLLNRDRRITVLISTHITRAKSGSSALILSIAGSLPRRQRRLVEAWAELHQAELRADWERLQEGQSPAPIEPLQ